MEFVSKQLRLPNQMTINYVERGEPNGIPLILMHGMGDTWHAFELMLPFFPPSIRTIAYTQRGHDGTIYPGLSYLPADHAEDLGHFMDALGLQRAILLGISSGGFAVRRFAIAHPERTLGLILLGAPVVLRGKQEVEDGMKDFSKLSDPIEEEFVRQFNQGMTTAPIPPDFFERIVKASLKVPAQVWIETAAGLLEEEFPKEAGKIKAPTLIMGGANDPLLPPAEMEALSQAIPQSRLLFYPDLGHLLYWEDPERITADITQFIQAIT